MLRCYRGKSDLLKLSVFFLIIIGSFSVMSFDQITNMSKEIINTEIISNILCYQKLDLSLECNMYFSPEKEFIIKEKINQQTINLKLLTAYQDFSIKNKETLEVVNVKEIVEIIEITKDTKVIKETINKPITHYIDITKTGFIPNKLIIKVGDTVVWKQTRAGNLKQAVVQGTRNHIGVKSLIMYEGEQFQKTFNEQGTFIYVDTISIYQVGKIIIE